MPELPEVETIRRALQRDLPGSRFVATEVREPRLRRRVSSRSLARLHGLRVESVDRRAKYLLLRAQGGEVLVVHLGMTGRVEIFTSGASPLRAHDHVRWQMRSAAGARFEMRFHDVRRFGLVLRLSARALPGHELFRHLGVEPLTDAFSASYLFERTRGARRPIKSALLDARLVVGVGNIYASEALWRARIHPRTAAGRVAASRCERLHRAVLGVLHEAIAAGGTTLSDYRDPQGGEGYFRIRLDVYGREGSSCRRCDGTIRRIVQAGRSTFYCPGCQH